jgi:hypothetical protein
MAWECGRHIECQVTRGKSVSRFPLHPPIDARSFFFSILWRLRDTHILFRDNQILLPIAMRTRILLFSYNGGRLCRTFRSSPLCTLAKSVLHTSLNRWFPHDQILKMTETIYKSASWDLDGLPGRPPASSRVRSSNRALSSQPTLPTYSFSCK